MIEIFQKCFYIILLSLLVLAITTPVLSLFEINDLESHFNEFSKYTVVHHENIDDPTETHSHVHKHSEGGKEHEHNHDHPKDAQSVKTMFTSNPPKIYFPNVECILGITESDLFSNPHPFGIFRPPRV